MKAAKNPDMDFDMVKALARIEREFKQQLVDVAKFYNSEHVCIPYEQIGQRFLESGIVAMVMGKIEDGYDVEDAFDETRDKMIAVFTFLYDVDVTTMTDWLHDTEAPQSDH